MSSNLNPGSDLTSPPLAWGTPSLSMARLPAVHNPTVQHTQPSGFPRQECSLTSTARSEHQLSEPTWLKPEQSQVYSVAAVVSSWHTQCHPSPVFFLTHQDKVLPVEKPCVLPLCSPDICFVLGVSGRSRACTMQLDLLM